MKNPIVAALLFSVTLNLPAQNAGSPTANPSVPTTDQDTPYATVQNDANSRVWERITYEQAPTGQAVSQKHHYTELATGLNHLVNGEWVESKEEIDILPNGTAQAVQGQHQAYFPGDIYEGQIELVTPDGKHLKSRPMGLSYFDGQNSVLIAQLTNSVGFVIGNNEVIYPNAFTGFKADLRYTYTKAGFEQDVILHEQPPIPESLGLSPRSTRLQVLTEFFNPPQPSIQRRPLVASTGLSLTDESLGFGAMQMVPGRAFLLGDNAAEATARVSKSWSLLDGRQFLVEGVPVDAIVNGLAALPQTAMNSSVDKTPHVASRRLALPPQRLVKKESTKAMMLAKNEFPAGGFVLDYQTINTSLTNYTFRGDMTYYISGSVDLYGTNTFEGGTVLKYTYGASINIGAGCGINWLGAPYHPVILTAQDDNSVGETLSGSTGNPTSYYARYALSFNNAGPFTLSNFRISYATNAIGDYQTDLNLYDGQFVNDQFGVEGIYYANKLRNVLMMNVLSDFTSAFSSIDSQNSTFSGSAWLNQSTYSTSMSFENCVFANLTNLTSGSSSTLTGTNNGFYKAIEFGTGAVTNSFYPFQTAGAGSYYLTNGCNFFNAGTTNVDSTLLASLRQKTTYPPIIYSNTTVSLSNQYNPQAQRDTDIPDLGYHYDPLDYAFGGVVVSSNITFNPGTATCWFELPGSGGPGFGIRLSGTGNAQFNGAVTTPCVLARYSTVQEGGNGNWTDRGWLAAVTSASGNSGPVEADAQFTHFFGLVADPNFFSEYYKPLILHAQNCEFSSAALSAYWMGQYFTNCLFDRVQWLGLHGNYSPMGFAMMNCTMHGGGLQITRYGGSWQAMITNCAFDGVDFSQMDATTNYTYCAYNAFLTPGGRTSVTNIHDVSVTNFNWQASWLGNFYLPTNSSLIDAGSTNADLLGLYNFTTQTNQTEETNSRVDMGYHYIALDANGNILDNDSDGVPDWEDANPNDPAIGALTITIDSPLNGFIFY